MNKKIVVLIISGIVVIGIAIGTVCIVKQCGVEEKGTEKRNEERKEETMVENQSETSENGNFVIVDGGNPADADSGDWDEFFGEGSESKAADGAEKPEQEKKAGNDDSQGSFFDVVKNKVVQLSVTYGKPVGDNAKQGNPQEKVEEDTQKIPSEEDKEQKTEASKETPTEEKTEKVTEKATEKQTEKQTEKPTKKKELVGEDNTDEGYIDLQ